jgi:hypothetical protein
MGERERMEEKREMDLDTSNGHVELFIQGLVL